MGEAARDWRDDEGRPHRDDCPARLHPSGREEWFRHGRLRREGGLAVVHANGSVKYFEGGVRHREDLGSLRNPLRSGPQGPELDLGTSEGWRRVAVVGDTKLCIRRLFPSAAKVIPIEVELFVRDDETEARTRVGRRLSRPRGPVRPQGEEGSPGATTAESADMIAGAGPWPGFASMSVLVRTTIVAFRFGK